ncbi:MAG: AsmA family protein [Desulfobacterales bacterium]|nr:AsmA family protein [Desulfobacterales bacterium]
MKTAFKWTAIAAAALVVVVIAALLIIPAFIDVNRYKPELEKYVSEATGRPLSVGGDVRLSLFPWAGVSFSDLKLGNTPAFAEKDFLTVKSFDVRVKLLPLLFKQVEVDRLVVLEPRIFLVSNKDGRVSWDFGAKPAEAGPSTQPGPTPAPTGLPVQSLMVGELSIQNGRLTWIDHGKGSHREISRMNLSLKDVSLERPVRFSFSASFNQKPLAAEGRFGPVGANIGQGAVPLEVKAEAFDQLKLQIKGTVENLLAAPRASLSVEASEFSPRKLFAEIGQPLPAAADARVLERLAFTAAVKADAKAVSVSDGSLALDDSKLTFNLNAREFSKPDLTFDFKLDRIDLDRYLPPKAAASQQKAPEAQAAPPGGQPASATAEKTDYTPLRQLIMDGRVAVGQLTVNSAKLEDVNLRVAARDGVLSLDPLTMKLYQGTASGKTVVDVKGPSPVTDLQLHLDRVQVHPLLKDLAGKDFLEGTAKAQMTLSMTGDDPARIKQTLGGKGSFVVSDGAIIGVDLAGMARNVKAALGGEVKSGPKPRTDFAELLVPFTIDNGVAHTSETTLKSPLLRLLAAGKADLVKETLDFRVDTKLVGTIKGQGDEKSRSGIDVPILVSGSFSNPSFRPDLEGIAKGELKKALAPLDAGEGKAKEKARDLIKGILPKKN